MFSLVICVNHLGLSPSVETRAPKSPSVTIMGQQPRDQARPQFWRFDKRSFRRSRFGSLDQPNHSFSTIFYVMPFRTWHTMSRRAASVKRKKIVETHATLTTTTTITTTTTMPPLKEEDKANVLRPFFPTFCHCDCGPCKLSGPIHTEDKPHWHGDGRYSHNSNTVGIRLSVLWLTETSSSRTFTSPLTEWSWPFGYQTFSLVTKWWSE